MPWKAGCGFLADLPSEMHRQYARPSLLRRWYAAWKAQGGRFLTLPKQFQLFPDRASPPQELPWVPAVAHREAPQQTSAYRYAILSGESSLSCGDGEIRWDPQS